MALCRDPLANTLTVRLRPAINHPLNASDRKPSECAGKLVSMCPRSLKEMSR
jgi:hypothetical protein